MGYCDCPIEVGHSELVEECRKPSQMFRQAQHDHTQQKMPFLLQNGISIIVL